MNTYLGKGILGDILRGSIENLTIFMGFISTIWAFFLLLSSLKDFTYFLEVLENTWVQS